MSAAQWLQLPIYSASKIQNQYKAQFLPTNFISAKFREAALSMTEDYQRGV